MDNKYLIYLSIIILIILYILLIKEKKKENFTEEEYINKIEKIIKEEEIPEINFVECDNINIKNNANINSLTSNTDNFKINSLFGNSLYSLNGEILNNSKSISNILTNDINLNNAKANSNLNLSISNLDLNNSNIDFNFDLSNTGFFNDNEFYINYLNSNNASILNYHMINDNSLFIKANDNDKTNNIVNYKNDIYKKVYCKNIKGRDSKTYSIMSY